MPSRLPLRPALNPPHPRHLMGQVMCRVLPGSLYLTSSMAPRRAYSVPWSLLAGDDSPRSRGDTAITQLANIRLELFDGSTSCIAQRSSVFISVQSSKGITKSDQEKGGARKQIMTQRKLRRVHCSINKRRSSNDAACKCVSRIYLSSSQFQHNTIQKMVKGD